ncbi:MAG: hypothetical protein B7X51_11165 [Pseudomonas sp. 34-62-33]|nr:MAG: hypothetical protein B7X51_11165 [Pseudomonas sp. 34-62-33]
MEAPVEVIGVEHMDLDDDIEVYDIEVDVDHSFIVAGVVVHNCPVCGARDGLKYGLDHRPVGHKLPWGSGPGAIHINCRCATTPWLKTYRELGLDIDEFEPTTRASADGPVSAGLTFEKWIESKPAAVQREWFGPGRYELYRDGKITLRDLTNMRGRELTLSQLRERYG